MVVVTEGDSGRPDYARHYCAVVSYQRGVGDLERMTGSSCDELYLAASRYFVSFPFYDNVWDPI